jgi:hypothetical protein
MGLQVANPESTPGRSPKRSTTPNTSHILLTIAIALGAIYFFIRGPLRAIAPGGSGDFLTHYNATRTYLQGGNPYHRADVVAEAIDSGHDNHIPGVNPHLLLQPGALLLFAPFALLPFPVAVWIWLLVELAATAGLWWAAVRLVELPRPQSVVLAAALLYLSPIHSAIAHGQVSLIFCALTVYCFWLLKYSRGRLAGIVLGILFTKITFALPVALIAIFHGRAKAIWWAALIAAAAWTPMAARYGIEQPVADYVASVQDAAAPGGTADDTNQNEFSHHQINARSWWHSWELPGVAREALTALTLAGLLLPLFRKRAFAYAPGWSDWYWSLAAIFLCVSVYHRFYDAALLAIPLAAIVKHWPSNLARVSALLLLPFAAPGATAMEYFTRNLDPGRPWFYALIVRHDAVCLLLAGFVLAWCLTRPSRIGQHVFRGN